MTTKSTQSSNKTPCIFTLIKFSNYSFNEINKREHGGVRMGCLAVLVASIGNDKINLLVRSFAVSLEFQFKIVSG